MLDKINLVMIDVFALQVNFTKLISFFHLVVTKSICYMKIKQCFDDSMLNE